MVILVTLWSVGALLLAVAGAFHIVDPKPLQRSLARFNVVPIKSGSTVVRLWGLIELGVGLGGLLAMWSGASLRPMASATALVYIGFTAYLWSALKSDGVGDCACIGAGTALDVSVLARAGLLAGVSVLTAVIDVSTTDAVLTLGMAAVLALLAWLVPAALHPADDPIYGAAAAVAPYQPQPNGVAV